MGWPVMLAAVLCAWLLVGGSADGVSQLVPHPSTSPGAAARPNLKISHGALRVRDGRQQGSFIVVNGGYAVARASTARLTARIDGKVRFVKAFRIPRLVAGGAKRVAIDMPFVTGRHAAKPRAIVCVDARRQVRESSESDNCHDLGHLEVHAAQRTYPTNPVAFRTDTVFTLGDQVQGRRSGYYVVVPKSYDRSHHTPTSLLIWLHGCDTASRYEIYTPSPAVRDGTPTQNWISIAPLGREAGTAGSDGCWHAGVDEPKVLAAIHSVESHFNIDRHRVVIGGFSSGGELAYRTIFDHADMFAGILAEGTLPFGSSGLTQHQAIAEASYTFHVVHVAHLQDDQYAIAEVRRQTNALAAAGFPLKRVERAGPHSAPDSGDTGTGHDADVYLFPHMYDGWRSP